MKKLLFLLLMFISVNVQAQESRRVYCELVGTQKLLSTKVIVTVDFGQETTFWTGGNFKQYLVDSKGKAINFNSMVDAMNYMGARGWKFEQAYVVTISNQNVYHWLLSKEIKVDENGTAGIMTKKQFEKAHKAENSNELGEIGGIKCWVQEKTENGMRIMTDKELSVEQLKRVKQVLSIEADLLQFNLKGKPEKGKAYAGISDGFIIIYATNEFIPLE